MKYEIQTWNQPNGFGHGWARCRCANTNDETMRYFVFNMSDEPMRRDWLNGLSFTTKEKARAAIAKAEGKDNA